VQVGQYYIAMTSAVRTWSCLVWISHLPHQKLDTGQSSLSTRALVLVIVENYFTTRCWDWTQEPLHPQSGALSIEPPHLLQRKSPVF
jgi:hypothetical protein